MVVEADESDGTFIKLPATIAVVTNIDPEHLDHWGHFDAIRDAFVSFVQNIPFYGFAAVCVDHPEVQNMIARIQDRRIVTYGFSPQADVRGLEIRYSPEGLDFDLRLKARGDHEQECFLKNMVLPMYGEHNVQNALAAIAVAWEMGLEEAAIRKGLANFSGVKRRFTKVGVAKGVTIIDDYGHHPVEISAVLKAARNACQGRVIAVVQPHRYSRLQSLFDDFCTCFNDADKVIVTDVFPAGELPIAGADRDGLVEGLRAHGHRDARPLPTKEDLPQMLATMAEAGDFVICLGAGNITQWANALPEALEKHAP